MKTDLQIANKYIALESSAKARGIEFDLPLQSLLNTLRAKKCHYTGVNLTPITGKPNSITLDRVDNSKGYVRGNVVACSQAFNARKANITKEDVAILAKIYGII